MDTRPRHRSHNRAGIANFNLSVDCLFVCPVTTQDLTVKIYNVMRVDRIRFGEVCVEEKNPLMFRYK